jgi:hypothetical protein
MIRGLWTHADVLYGVDGDDLFSMDSDGNRRNVLTLNSTAGFVDFASNLTQLVVNDQSYLYAYNPSSEVTAIAANYPGGARIAAIDQRVVFQYQDTQKFGWTALGDASSIDVLDFFSAESSPDKLVAILAPNHEIWAFGKQSTEVWDSIGGLNVFQKTNRAAIDYGCAAAYSAQLSANAVTWLSRDERGQAMVLRTQGYQPSRISTRAIEERFEGLDLANARAFTYSDGGQQFYCLNVPGVDTTLVYDETFQQWHERAELVDGRYTQWRPTCHAFAYGKHYFGTREGTIYTSDRNVHTYGDDVIARDRIAPVISAPSHKRLSFPSFEIICEKATAGLVSMRYSDDNGATWSDWRTESAGSVGDYARRVRFYKNGSGFDRVFQVRMTADAPFNPVAVAMEVH